MARDATRRILIVDNHAVDADSLAMLLRTMGHHVFVARHASIALEISRQVLPQLVLVSTVMPEMSGYELARRMRDLLGDRVKLCALTGNGLERDRVRSLESGLDHHMVKPVAAETLRKLLA
jgi:DNA-binding response OmpR family regulator